MQKIRSFQKLEVSEELGLVFGFAIVCKIDGEDYYDLNVDVDEDEGTFERVPEHITEDAMLNASTDFAKSARPGNEMHDGPETGTYVHTFPLTTDIAEKLGITTKMTGLLVAYAPDPEVLKKFKDGTYKGFSIEGSRVKFEDVEHG